jgi:hypothetical protein
MPWVGFEPTIPAFELAKTVHASDRAAAVIDNFTKHKKRQSIFGLILFKINYEL